MTRPVRVVPRAVVFLAMWLLAWGGDDRTVRVFAAGAEESTYAITAWASDSAGPPGDVFAIAQDLQGYLWLGTPSGIVRFDGDRFDRWPVVPGHDPLPEGPVYALVGARDGGLWVALGTAGGVAHASADGRVRTFPSENGAPAGISGLIEDRQGVVWVAGRQGLFRLDGERWTGVDDAQAFSLHQDSRGAIWVGSAAGVYRLFDGAIELIDETARQVDALGEDASGTVWMSDYDRFVRRVTTNVAPTPGPGVRGPAGAWRILGDEAGELWVATWASLMRIPDPSAATPVIEKIDYEQRLAGSPRALFEDRDGNIWVGMRGGLLRLSPSSVRAVEPLEGLTNQGVRTVAAGPDGSVWVATDYALNRYTATTHEAYDVARITALHADRHGLWLATPDRFGRFGNGRFEPASVRSEFQPRRVLAMTTDAAGALWLCSALDGPLRWDGHRLDRFDGQAALFGRACSTVFTDRRGRVWVGFQEGGVVVAEGGAVRAIGAGDGLTPGTVLAMLEDERGSIWLSTTGGINRYQDGTVLSITSDNGPFTEIVPFLVEDDDGYIWVGVNSSAAAVRFDPRQVDALTKGSFRYLEYAYFDETDGMQQGSLSWQAGVGGVRGTDGRLWVATGPGLSVIDPQRLPTSRLPSSPSVEALVVDGRRGPAADDLVLPPGTATLDVEYGSVHLTSASKLRYRYRLDGIDDDWVPAGGVRRASYSDLPPGTYQFRVSATDTGRWTDESMFAFSIAPPFYRTAQFFALAFLATGLLVVAAWWLRLRAVQRRYALVFAERARVSREIHDTLLQSLAAIGVELETIASQTEPAASALRGELGRLRRNVGHSLRDARESILELRRSPMERRPLADSLRSVAKHAHARRDAPLAFALEGRPRPTPADIDAQCVRIAQEAVTNALKHSGATRIEITLAYEPGRLRLRVADDGRGFDRATMGAPSEAGEHLGLLTMQERAERIGGRLSIASEPGAGTTVELVLPLEGI